MGGDYARRSERSFVMNMKEVGMYALGVSIALVIMFLAIVLI